MSAATAPALTGEIPSGPEALQLWKDTGSDFVRKHDGLQWLIGDWLVEGQSSFGEKTAYAEAEAITGKKRQTLYQFASVAKRVLPCMRHTNLTWEHHQIVAPLEPDNQRAWLDIAEKRNWTAKQLRAEVIPRTKKTESQREWMRLVVPIKIDEYESLQALAVARGVPPVFRDGRQIESAGAAILVRAIALEFLQANAKEVEMANYRAARKSLRIDDWKRQTNEWKERNQPHE